MFFYFLYKDIFFVYSCYGLWLRMKLEKNNCTMYFFYMNGNLDPTFKLIPPPPKMVFPILKVQFRKS